MYETKKNQHYVPRSYLKRFSIPESSGKKVMMYNIGFDKIEKDKSISNIASEPHFYDSEIDTFISSRHPIQGTENTLGDIETYMSALMAKLEKSLLRGIEPTEREIEDISYFLFLQYVRTRSFRDKMYKSATDEFSIQAQLAFGISQPEIFMKPLNLFKSRRYILGEAERGKHFVTSDNPVVFVPNISLDLENLENTENLMDTFYHSQRFEDKKGLDFVLPLSRRYVLIGIDEHTSPINLMRKQTSVQLNNLYTNNIIGGVAVSAHKYIIGAHRDDLIYAGKMLKFKQEELNSRSDEDKEKIETILRRVK